jgi:hypothetical protein
MLVVGLRREKLISCPMATTTTECSQYCQDTGGELSLNLQKGCQR